MVPITVYRYLSITSVWRTNIYHKYVSQHQLLHLLVITMYNIPIQIRVSNCKPSHPGMRGSLKSKWVGWFNYYGSKALVVSDPAANRDDKPHFFSSRLSKEVQVHSRLTPERPPSKWVISCTTIPFDCWILSTFFVCSLYIEVWRKHGVEQ